MSQITSDNGPKQEREKKEVRTSLTEPSYKKNNLFYIIFGFILILVIAVLTLMYYTNYTKSERVLFFGLVLSVIIMYCLKIMQDAKHTSSKGNDKPQQDFERTIQTIERISDVKIKDLVIAQIILNESGLQLTSELLNSIENKDKDNKPNGGKP
ncbi:MAG: hypothetical protein HY960_02995 [Ignavibacteriae bacterium]|nr:hypothetical protein [Ignavibacteriota bacterium]